MEPKPSEAACFKTSTGNISFLSHSVIRGFMLVLANFSAIE